MTAEPTTAAPGAGVYTAEFSNLQFESQTKTVEIPKIATYTVTFDADGGTPAPASQTVAQGAKATEPTAPTKTGYTFGGWYNDSTKYDFSTPVTANLTLKAKWTLKSYTVTFDADGGTGTMASQTVNHGASFTLPACGFTAPSGKQFDRWDIGGTSYAPGASVTVTGPVTVKAVWKDLPPSITGSVSGSKVSYTLKRAPAGAALIAARYDGDQMTDIQIVPDVSSSGTLTMGGSGTKFKLFLVGSNWKPLCPAWSN